MDRAATHPFKVEDFHDLASYAETMGEPEWLITNLFERQSRTIIAGAEGAGKSLAVFTLAAQAAAGLSVLGNPDWRPPLPIRTCYIELEMSRRTVARRAHSLKAAAVVAGMPIPPEAIAFIRLDGLDPNIRRSRDAQSVVAQIRDLEPDLTVIDPVYRMMPTDGVKEDAFGPLIGFLDEIRATGSATILVHHLRKASGGDERGKQASDLFGSSFLLRFPELVAFVHDDGDHRGRLVVKKDREGFFEDQGDTFHLRRGGSWPIGLLPVEARDHSLRVQITDLLANEGAKSLIQISREVGVRKQTVTDMVRAMADDGLIQRRGSGPRVTWALAEAAEAVGAVRDAFGMDN